MSFKTDMFMMTGKGAPEDSVDKYKRDNRGKDLDKEWTYQEVWDELFNSGNVLPQTLTEAHRVVYCDADALVYRVSAACETRSVTTTVEGVAVEFPTRTLLKEYCVDVDVEYEDLIVTDKYVNEPVSHCLSTLKKSIRNIYKELNATHVIFFLGGSGNFRLDLPLPTQYKAARKHLHRPEYLKDCREFLNKYYDTYIIKGVEADDVVQSTCEHTVNNERAYGIAWSLDKDFHVAMKQNRYYHPIHKEIVELSGGIGKLELKGNGVKGDGLHWLLFQTMQGDPSDNYSPKPLFNVRFGEKSYHKHFKDFTNEKDLLLAWINKWKELLPESIEFTVWDGTEAKHDWLSLANLYMKAPYMLTHPNDTTTFSDILERYGVEYE